MPSEVRSKIRPPTPLWSTTSSASPLTVWSDGHQVSIREVHTVNACSAEQSTSKENRSGVVIVGTYDRCSPPTAETAPRPRPKCLRDTPGPPAHPRRAGDRSAGSPAPVPSPSRLPSRDGDDARRRGG